MGDRILKAFPTLTTERLILRQLANSDVAEIFTLRSDRSINKYLDRQPSKTMQDAADFIQNIKNHSLSYWAVTRKGDEKLIGTICLFDISAEQTKGEIGFELLTDFQGKGFMREAAKAILRYAHQTLGLQTIDASVHEHNQSSINLIEELHFKKQPSADERDATFILFQLKHGTEDFTG